MAWTQNSKVFVFIMMEDLLAQPFRKKFENQTWKLKAAGCNAIRTSHNPVAPEFLDLCDQLGFLVMAEAFDEWDYPKNKWIDGWNQTQAGHNGYPDIFEQWSEKDLYSMVYRDKIILLLLSGVLVMNLITTTIHIPIQQTQIIVLTNRMHTGWSISPINLLK